MSDSPVPPPTAAPAASPVRDARRLGRFALRLAVLLYFIAGGLFLFVREVAVPRVAEYRPRIEAALGAAIGLPVRIDELSADWSGLRPRLHIGGLQISEADGSAALRFERVDAVLAWSSLLRLGPYFHRLELFSPELAIRRDAQGRFFVAGLEVDPGAGDSDGGALDWLLAQREILIRDAVLGWTDELRGAPELRLERVSFRLERRVGRHRFGLTAEPPAGLASRLDLRGRLAAAGGEDPADWRGELYLALDHAELGAWRPWLDYPVELSGSGGVRAWIGLEGAERNSLAVNLALDGVSTRLAPELPVLDLASLRGRLDVRRGLGTLALQARELGLQTGDGVALAPVDLDLTLRDAGAADGEGGEFQASQLDFAALARLAAHLPLDDSTRARLAAFDPRGMANGVHVGWQGDVAAPERWSLRGRFDGIGLAAQGVLPGLGGLSGEVDGDERGGRYRIAGSDAWLDLPKVFPEPRLSFSMLRAEGGWTRRNGRFTLELDSAVFENPDAAGSASGRYWPAAGGPGEIDLNARLTRADGPAVWRYMPLVVNQDTRTWLRHGIVGGSAPEARLRLHGDLARFPFRDGVGGQFLVTAKVAGARLDYAEGWPSIEGIDGELRFEGASMRITAERGSIYGVHLSGVSADLPDLEAHGEETMTIRGHAAGPTADFLRFVANSPVAGRIDRFTDAMRAEGNGDLDLTLVMPLRKAINTTVAGSFRFADNRLWVVDGLPPLESASGQLRFTGDTLAIPEARARLLGEPLTLSARTGADGVVGFSASGMLNAAALRQELGWPVLEHVSGVTPWQTDIQLRKDGTRVHVQSELVGLSASLPAPLNKSATERWPLQVEVDSLAGGQRQRVTASLGERLALMLERQSTPLGWAVERGGLGVFRPARPVAGGVQVDARLDELDVDAWRRALGEGESAGGGLPLAGVNLSTGRLLAFGRTLHDLELRASAHAADWQGTLESREAAGQFDWLGAGAGALRARLARLHLSPAEAEASARVEDASAAEEGPRRLPAVDLLVDAFTFGERDFGELEVKAVNRSGEWLLETLGVRNADGRLSGQGAWRPGLRPVTRMDFNLEADNVGRLLRRLGYPDAVRDGRARLEGKLDWRGHPLTVDYPSLSGEMKLEAESGQFNKLEPGVGRLLGVLSLQSLPRRINLDFRDVFSEGFAFDRVSGSIAVDAGVMRTEDLLIRGPAARIALRGSVDLQAESQDLRVTVQPTLSESIAIGAAAGLINPVAGVVTYIAQKALSDPIEKLLAFDYAVSGPWSEPKVEKLTGREARATTPIE
ncbi:TIGR02099 family protein [Pseudothauera nasutitermitis]|uniref:TIGR02099 family protein n=1 Tax=Pseudothauera nasutitermitis TaxID=2565930 RepID=A0A4S4AR62_9RHOO|nr:YhdP family protein [Pseudothauera nasutitermitis]THF62283.1 TIGR02099 family protein [Pseudothauera nasutitermitis]